MPDSEELFSNNLDRSPQLSRRAASGHFRPIHRFCLAVHVRFAPKTELRPE
jgi:hypothetical protein